MLYNFELDFKIDKESQEFVDLTLDKTKEKLKELEKVLSKDLVNSIFSDMEEFMYERLDNVRSRYFSEIYNFLIGSKNCYISKERKEDLEHKLSEVGYDVVNFRKKIYEENKEVILDSLTEDYIYEYLDRKFGDSSIYWKSWYFSDIKVGYPQSIIIRGFLKMLMDKSVFDETVQEMLSDEIKEKQDELKDLENKLDDIRRQIGQINQLEGEEYGTL